MSSSAPRIAFLHTGAVNIAPFGALAAEFLPGATVVNYLDDRIVADLGDEARADSVPERIDDLVRAAAAGGADAVMFTCSSISELAAPAAAAAGVPVLRVDEAMADAAVRAGRRIRVLATLPTTCRPTLGLLQERAALAGVEPEFTSEVIEGAFAAVAGGDRPTHDRLPPPPPPAPPPPAAAPPSPTSSCWPRHPWPPPPRPCRSTCRCSRAPGSASSVLRRLSPIVDPGGASAARCSRVGAPRPQLRT
ncbi:aspartate/glutamate racemase family protein [Microbacterium sp. C23T]